MASPPSRPPQQPPLCVAPLNSMPYIKPITSDDNDSWYHCQGDSVEPAHPALLYLASQPTEEDRNQLLSVKRDGIVLTGSAAVGFIGPVVGKRDVFESRTTYLFRVCIPGVQKEEFICQVSPDGIVTIKGATITGEKVVFRNSMRFDMQSQNLCPPGHFSVSFQLPGPVQFQDLTCHFGMDGVFEGVVKKLVPSEPTPSRTYAPSVPRASAPSAPGSSAPGSSAPGSSAPGASAPEASAPGASA